MFVRCEKLILVRDPRCADWWRALLEPGQAMFDGGGRCEAAADEVDARRRWNLAREEGFRPIVLCPNAGSRERLTGLFGAVPALILVNGYDDTNIASLLSSPSREALLGLAGRRVLIEPSAAYMQALNDWVASHRAAAGFIQRVAAERIDLRLEDFDLVAEPDADGGTQPASVYGFEWRLDPAHRLTLTLRPAGGEASLAYRVDGSPSAGSLKAGAQEWHFDADGRCVLAGADLTSIADVFELDDNALRHWDDPAIGPSLPAELFTRVKTWVDERVRPRVPSAAQRVKAAYAPLLNPLQWKTVLAALLPPSPEAMPMLQGRLALPVRGREIQGRGRDMSEPWLQVASAEPDFILDVTWMARGGHAAQRPTATPSFIVTIDGVESVQGVRWEDDNRRVVLPGLMLLRPFRYGWNWDGQANRLSLYIETQPPADQPAELGS